MIFFINYIISRRDVLLAIHNFSELKSLTKISTYTLYEELHYTISGIYFLVISNSFVPLKIPSVVEKNMFYHPMGVCRSGHFDFNELID